MNLMKNFLILESVTGLNTTSDEVQKAFKEKLESHIEQLKKQMKEVRDENDKNQKKCHELQEYLNFFFPFSNQINPFNLLK